MPALGDGDLLLEGLADAHRVDGISGLVSAEADDAPHTGFDGRGEDVVRSDDVGAHGLHREELAAGDLLQRCRVEYVIDPRHRAPATFEAADVADVEFDLVGDVRVPCLVLVAHVVLLLLVAGEDADLADVRAQEAPQDGVAERSGPAGDHQGLVFENGHIVIVLYYFHHFGISPDQPWPRSQCSS